MEEKFLPAAEQGAAKNSPFLTRKDLNNPSTGYSFADFDLSRLTGRYNFSQKEKLKSQKTIDKLFAEGKAVSQNGFTLVYLITSLDTPYPAQAGFSVPKKYFKHAHDRNRVKRLMREAYRHHKMALYEKAVAQKKQIALMFVYKGKELPSLEFTTQSLVHCLNRILKS